MEKLQSKINYLVKDDEKNLIRNSKRLLGFMYVDEGLYKEIQLKAKQILKYPNNNRYEYTYSEKSMIVTMAAILFCMHEVNGSRFWEELSGKYQMQELNLQSEIKSYITSFLSVSSLPWYQGTKRTEYVETIQMQSVISNNHSSKIVKAVYYMYVKDLDMDITEINVNALLKYLTEAFNYQVKKFDDKNEEKPTSMTMQLQSIPKSFMKAYLTNNKRVKSLIKRYFLHFDTLSKKQVPAFNSKNRFDILFQKGLKDLNFIEMESNAKRNSKESIHKAVISAKIKGQVNPLFYILIPQHYINPEKIIHSKAAVIFYSTQEVLKEKKIRLKEGGISWKTIPKQYELEVFSSELSYKISYDNTVLYDSKKELFREYVFFDDQTVSNEVQISEIKNDQYFYLLAAPNNQIIFENNIPIISELDYGILYYFKAQPQMRIIMNDQVLFDTTAKEKITPKLMKETNNEINKVNNVEYYNDVYLNMMYVYENPKTEVMLANHLAESYKVRNTDYYLQIFATFEELISENKDFKPIDVDILVFILDMLEKENAIELIRVFLKRIYGFIEQEKQLETENNNLELIEVCQSYAKKYAEKLDFFSLGNVEIDNALSMAREQRSSTTELVVKPTIEEPIVFSILSESISVGFQSMLKQYSEADDIKLNELTLLNKFMDEYEAIEVGEDISLPINDKEIILNHIAFQTYKDNKLKILGSINGNTYYWIYTVNLKNYPELLLNVNKHFRMRITDGRSYNYSFDNNRVTVKEGSYLLELQNI